MVARRVYAPERGDLIWLDFNPVRGHEQNGRRPALAVSPKKYNAKSGLALVCPITSQIKGYPFEVMFKAKAIQGAILADQIRSVAWKERRTEKIDMVSEAIVAEVQEHMRKLVLE